MNRLGADCYDVATVANIDRVLGQKLVEFPRDAVWMNGAGLRAEQWHEFLGLRLLYPAKLIEPRLAAFRAVVAHGRRGVEYRAENRAGISDESQGDIAILAHRAVVHVDMNDGRIGAQTLAVAHAEIERCADDDDDIGLLERIAPRAVEVVRVARRQQAAGGAVHVARDIQAAQQRDGFLVSPAGPDLCAEQDGRPFGLHEQIREPLDVGRVADGLGRCPVAARLGDNDVLERHLGVQNVTRYLQVARSGCARKALAHRHRDHIGDALGRARAGGELGDGRGDVDVG